MKRAFTALAILLFFHGITTSMASSGKVGVLVVDPPIHKLFTSTSTSLIRPEPGDDTVNAGKTRARKGHASGSSITDQIPNQTRGDREDVDVKVKRRANNSRPTSLNISLLQASIDERISEHTSIEAKIGDTGDRSIIRQRNKIRLAIYSIEMMGVIMGEDGRELSGTARRIGASFSAMEKPRKNIRERHWVTKMLFGGDRQAAAKIRSELRGFDRQLKDVQALLEGPGYGEASNEFAAPRMKILLAEEYRLSELARQQEGSTGLIGWLFY
ncbi:hypothetical protein ACFLRF_02980 [Candidatus Altiarchaeota archaeon]